MMYPPNVTSKASPSTVPSASTSVANDDDIDPIHRPPPANYAAMSAEEKRRYERNVREQQRSFKISQQIKELRTVLTESGIPFKPNKFSILISVVDYIKQLQSRAIMVDSEHHKLINTLRATSEMVNSGQIPSDSDEQTDKSSDITDDDMLFVQGLEYKSIFQQCSAALGVAALDGRILACNQEFSVVTGISKDELLRQSVFNLMQNHEEVFRAMGEMLSSTEGIVQAEKNASPPPPMYWSGVVSQQNQQNLFMNITLTRSEDGLPKFFNCALTTT